MFASMNDKLKVMIEQSSLTQKEIAALSSITELILRQRKDELKKIL